MPQKQAIFGHSDAAQTNLTSRRLFDQPAVSNPDHNTIEYVLFKRQRTKIGSRRSSSLACGHLQPPSQSFRCKVGFDGRIERARNHLIGDKTAEAFAC